jgi:hypothetical protein
LALLTTTVEGKDPHRRQMEAECLRPSSRLGNRRSCHCCTLGTATPLAVAVAAPGGTRPTPSPHWEESITVMDGGHRRCCPSSRCCATVAMPEVVEEAVLKRHATSGVKEGGHALKRKEEATPSRGRRKPCPRMLRRRSHPQEEGGSRALAWSPGHHPAPCLVEAKERDEKIRLWTSSNSVPGNKEGSCSAEDSNPWH